MADGAPVFTEQDVEERVGARSFAAGLDYARRGAIFSARRQGLSLKGQCEGTSGGPYRVRADFDADGIADASCSCPVGDGGFCKHVAALLLTWLRDPDQFVEIEETEVALEHRSKAELIALIKQMLRQQPSLELLLETPLPVAGARQQRADPEAYRRQVAAIFRGVEYEWGEEAGVAQELGAIAAIGDGFLEQGQYANALAVYEAILTEVLRQYEQFSDEGGELGGVITDCVDALGRCLAGETDAAVRERILRALFGAYAADVGFGGFGFADAVPDVILGHARPEELRLVAGWVEQALPVGEGWSADFERQTYGGFLLQLQGDTLDDETFLRICRETGRTRDAVARLLESGRVEEAIAEAAPADDGTLLGAADLLVAHGHGDAAERLVRDRAGASQDRRLLGWLKQHYQARGDQAAALDMALALFRGMPDRADYREIRDLALPLGRWETLRPELHGLVKEKGYADLLIQLTLDDGEIDRALELLRSVPPRPVWQGYGYHMHGSEIELQVAEAASETRPAAAREIYRTYAERLIEARGRPNYQQASELLTRVRDLSIALGEEDWWERYVAGLRDTHRQLRALRDELNKAGL